MSKPKTIFCDIDGTLIKHAGPTSKQALSSSVTILKNTIKAIDTWDKLGYKIILTTGRKESLRSKTETELIGYGITYDQLIMGIGGGDRILINDRKDKGKYNTAYALNVVKDKGLDHYDFTHKFVTISDKQLKNIKKVWGSEELIEYNDHYVVKKLFMKKGECCSMQYHELKRETIYILSGKIKLYIGNDINNIIERIMLAHDTITIEPYTIHRMEGIEDSYYLESSTNELYDVIRLQDKYNRL